MPRRTSLPQADLAAPGPATEDRLLAETVAVGSAPSEDARRVDLVWNDPETGARLSVGLLASPDLIDGLRRDGFEVVVSDDPASGGAAA
ncbi:MAG: hypothetical protein AAGB93_07565 [Planctomycetota bacterium]